MNTRIAKLLITLALLAQILTACNFGKHSVTVELPHNDCGVTACTTDTKSGGIFIK